MPSHFALRHTAAALLAAGLLTGCAPDPETAPTDTGAADTPAAWRLAAAPEDALSVVDAKATAQPGAAVAVVGRVGGRLEPITAESGLFVIMDESLPSCADMPGDTCPTPWDYCCESPGDVAEHAATVQLRDDAGRPIALGAGDIEPLETVVVVGTVAPGSTAESLVIHATAVATP